MHPAFSVIVFTTLIGAGQGLFLALFAGQALALFGVLPEPDPRGFYGAGSALVFILLGAGLVASFFHLGRPERAWRSAACWRTSWLSREVIVLPAFMGVVALYGGAHWLELTAALAHLPGGYALDATLILGALGLLLTLALFVCTAMIYACIKFLAEWHSPLTVVNYFLLGSASGFTLAAAFAALRAPETVRFYGLLAGALTLAALVGRSASLVRNARLRPKSSLQTALGIRHPHIVQRSAGFVGSSFNTREFFHRQPLAFVRGVKWAFLAGAFALPLLLLAIGSATGSAALLAAAFAVQYLGLLAERWYFFAQANHPQNLYYQFVN